MIFKVELLLYLWQTMIHILFNATDYYFQQNNINHIFMYEIFMYGLSNVGCCFHIIKVSQLN